MVFNVEIIGNNSDFFIYGVPQNKELWAICTNNLSIFPFKIFRLKKILLVDNNRKKFYELKQHNIFFKLLIAFFLPIYFPAYEYPSFVYYENGVKCGRFKTPLIVKNNVWHIFHKKNKTYSFSCHKPNCIACMDNDKQIMKINFVQGKSIADRFTGGKYTVQFDANQIDTTTAFLMSIYIDTVMFPPDCKSPHWPKFYDYEDPYFERTSWNPK